MSNGNGRKERNAFAGFSCLSLQNQRDVNYRLLNSQTMFEIDADTGRVTTRIPLNLGSYPLQIEVSDVSTTLVCMRTALLICAYFMYV